MINAFIYAVFKIILGLLRFISNLLLLPLTIILRAIIPDLSFYLNTANYFLDNYVIKGIAVGREIILNMTGFPEGLLAISVNIAIIMLGYIATIRILSFVRNIWRLWKGG